MGALAACSTYFASLHTAHPTTLPQVEWEEINAALGQALLLLDVMAMRLHFKLDHKLKPRGSLSKIEVDGREMPLYGPPGRGFGEQK